MAKNARDALHRGLQLFAFAGHVFIVAFLENVLVLWYLMRKTPNGQSWLCPLGKTGCGEKS